jgi:transcriptional regulator with XRE-family HTH domain
MGDFDANDDLFDGWTPPRMMAATSTEAFAARAAELRRDAGLSFRQLGARVGVSHAYLVAVEGGRERPSAELVVRLAAVFDADLDELAALACVLPPDLEPVLGDVEVQRWLRRVKGERFGS